MRKYEKTTPTIQSQHHRRPRSKGGKTTPENISIVDQLKHRSWHTLFANLDAHEICEIINSVWLDPAYKFECKKGGKNEHY